MHSRRGRLLGRPSVIVLALGLALTSAGTAMAQDEERVPIRIGAASNVAFGPQFVLDDDELGIDAAHGLDVDVRIFANGVETMEAALAGELDVAFPNSRALFPNMARGACFKGPLLFVNLNSVRLVTSTDIESAEDLVGRSIGTVSGAVGEIALHLWLDSQGVERDAVEIVNIAPPDLPVAFAQGTVDGIIWVEPTPAQTIEVVGEENAHYTGDIGSAYLDISPVNVTCDWYEQHGDEAMEALTAAWIEAVEHIRSDPEAAAAITAERLQLEPQEVLDIWESGDWLAGWPANWTDQAIDMQFRYIDYMLSIGALEEAPDLGEWIDTRWLREVAPERVMVEEYDF